MRRFRSIVLVTLILLIVIFTASCGNNKQEDINDDNSTVTDTTVDNNGGQSNVSKDDTEDEIKSNETAVDNSELTDETVVNEEREIWTSPETGKKHERVIYRDSEGEVLYDNGTEELVDPLTEFKGEILETYEDDKESSNSNFDTYTTGDLISGYSVDNIDITVNNSNWKSTVNNIKSAAGTNDEALYSGKTIKIRGQIFIEDSTSLRLNNDNSIKITGDKLPDNYSLVEIVGTISYSKGEPTIRVSGVYGLSK